MKVIGDGSNKSGLQSMQRRTTPCGRPASSLIAESVRQSFGQRNVAIIRSRESCAEMAGSICSEQHYRSQSSDEREIPSRQLLVCGMGEAAFSAALPFGALAYLTLILLVLLSQEHATVGGNQITICLLYDLAIKAAHCLRQSLQESLRQECVLSFLCQEF